MGSQGRDDGHPPDPGHDHPHEHFGRADLAALATRRGVRATWLSLGGLALTATLQLAIVAVTGSVALLADTIHNFTDCLPAVPPLHPFPPGRRPPHRRLSLRHHPAPDPPRA